MPKYTLITHDTLKCAACGNKDFEERHKAMHTTAGDQTEIYPEKWLYVCNDCGHAMKFFKKAEIKTGMF